MDLDTTEFTLVVYAEKEDINKYLNSGKDSVMHEVPCVTGEYSEDK